MILKSQQNRIELVTRLGLGQTGYHNESMIQVALTLLSAALETGASHLHKFESLLELAKDDLPRNLIALLKSERVSIFPSALWIRSGHISFYSACFLQKKS